MVVRRKASNPKCWEFVLLLHYIMMRQFQLAKVRGSEMDVNLNNRHQEMEKYVEDNQYRTKKHSKVK